MLLDPYESPPDCCCPYESELLDCLLLDPYESLDCLLDCWPYESEPELALLERRIRSQIGSFVVQRTYLLPPKPPADCPPDCWPNESLFELELFELDDTHQFRNDVQESRSTSSRHS